MTHPELATCSLVVPQEVAWGHLDSYGHVNNVIYFHYFENARVEWLRRVGWFDLKESCGMGPIVASTAAKFRKPLTWPDRIHVGVRVAAISTDRVTVEHILVSERWQAVAAEGPAVMVNYDYRKGSKAEFPDELRAAIERLSGPQTA